MKRILYLYREIMPYNIPVLKELVSKGFKISVIHRESKKKTSYTHPNLTNVDFLDEAEFDGKSLKKIASEINPDLVFICDWSIAKYNSCGTFLRKRFKIPVVVGCDTQWRGGKQWANVFSSRLRHQRYFSHILVAGVRQYEYAKRIGFKNDRIIMNLLSADLDKFEEAEVNQEKFKENRNFLFVGRFIGKKGVKELVEAWNGIANKKNSKLIMVGEGPLKKEINFPDDVEIHPFVSQSQLLKYAERSSCFLLPSIFEPWALVIHEFAAAGLPLIVTNSCGATPHFVINNYNGLIVSSGSSLELKNAIEKIINMSDQELFEYAKRSRILSKSISPEIVANSLISVL